MGNLIVVFRELECRFNEYVFYHISPVFCDGLCWSSMADSKKRFLSETDLGTFVVVMDSDVDDC